jgi:hypothetical protein
MILTDSMKSLLKGTLILIVVMSTFAPKLAMATLGEPAQSVAADQSILGGQVRTLSRQEFQMEHGRHVSPLSKAPYTVEQISTPPGVTVDEYVSSNGTVFAVSWRGPRPPNLSQLLGSYFTEYQTAAASPHARRRGLVVQTPKLVVETGGHMRDLWGRAYLPGSLPPGVSADEIQ